MPPDSRGFFSAHGEAAIEIKGQCLIIKLVGAFNLEGVLLCTEKAELLIAEMREDSWFLVIDYSDFDLVTVDSLPILEDFYTSIVQRKVKGILRVGAKAFVRGLSDSMFQRLEINTNGRDFERMSDLAVWIDNDEFDLN